MDLKQVRASAKAAITKVKSDIEAALAEGRTHGVAELVNKLKDKLSNFKGVHEEYMQTILNEADIHREGQYYSEVVGSAQELIDIASDKCHNAQADNIKKLKAKIKLQQKQFQIEEEERRLAQRKKMLELESELYEESGELSDVESEPDRASISMPTDHASSESVSSEASVILHQQRQLIDLLAAPKLEIPIFDGSPMQYFPFIKAFEDNVERVVPDSSARLTRLLQYTTGPAKNLIQCCAMMTSSEGYKRARELLQERFGNVFTVSQSFIERATNGPPIKGDSTLRTYSDDLRNGFEMLKAMNCLDEVNVQSNLVKILTRLPSYIQNRWRREVSQIKRKQHRLPTFIDLVSLVEDAADEANDPVFGNSVRSNSSASKPNPPLKNSTKLSTFNTNTAKPIKCYNCSGAHSIYSCERFKTMNPGERAEVVRLKKLCCNCLRGNHRLENCRSEHTCQKCRQPHHTLLHEEPAVIQSAYVGDTYGAGETRIALPVVAVKVKAIDGSQAYSTYALLDTGSTSTFISKSLMTKLGIEGQRRRVALTTLENTSNTSWMSACSIVVSDMHESNNVRIHTAYSRETLPIKEENIAKVSDLDAWPHLRGIDLPSATKTEVELLIGQDAPECLVPQTVISGQRGEPYAVRTNLGWTLNGPIGTKGSTDSNQVTSAHVSLEEQVEKFWKIDSPDIYSNKVEMSANDREVLRMWDENIRKDQRHYELPIPFKNKSRLQDNKELASSRLRSLDKKLKNTHIHEQYTNEINELLRNGYAEEVVDNNSDKNPGQVWYLPHHPVINPNKPKLRIVFDCAAKYRGVSLNDCAFQGPDLTNKLVGVLLRFRQNKVAFMADIKTMFYQVKVPPVDRDYLRFLWYPDGKMENPPKTYRMTVHPFGGCWSPSCCTYALQRAAEDHECSEATKTAIRESFYVDDCLCTTSDLSTAKTIATELHTILAKAGFTLTKWTSNNLSFISTIPIEDRAPSIKDLDLEALPIERALGVIWDTKRDVLTYNISLPTKPATKRGILSVLSSVYDPLGLVSPFILRARQIVQELFRRSVSWDEAIPEDLHEQWQCWIQEVSDLESFSVPRCVAMVDETKELHYFSDASEGAYGVAVYMRCTQVDGSIHTKLLMAKSRLAPLKGMTIPRLELSAASVAAQLDEHLREQLKLPKESSYFWTDSTIVLGYLKNRSKRYKTFVSNRVTQIQELTNIDNWRHVPTHLNPADDCSRGMTAADLTQNERWIHGPAFLSEPHHQWPECNIMSVPESDPELKAATTLHGKVSPVHPIDELVTARSRWTDVKRAVAWLLLVRDVLRKKRKPHNRLDTNDLAEAEKVILMHAQSAIPSDTQTTKMLQGLNASPDHNGLLKARGRLSKAPIPEHSRFPIILPRCRVAELIIRERHEMNGHVGCEFTLSLVMSKYWIIGARRIIKGVINNCITCNKIRQTPVQQQMADLPKDRVTPGSHAFANVGCDYFGPFLVKRGRGREKRYGCIFTCLTTRAVHLEIAPGLDTSSFINCLARFIARRGKPDLIRSDNGTNFVGAERELREEVARLKTDGIHKRLANDGIEWKFNPPGASHMGGVWERQIRSVRKIMAGLTHEQVLTDDALSTLMCNIESILNNRPITVVSTDPNDFEPLTPNHLLILRPSASLPGEFKSADLYCRSSWRQVQYLASLFWTRWLKEYLPHLQLRSKWFWEKKNLSEGDIVLLIDNSAPRNTWSLGKVLETYTGSDGKVRTVKVKTKDSEIIRPVTKLCRLECYQGPTLPVVHKEQKQDIHGADLSV